MVIKAALAYIAAILTYKKASAVAFSAITSGAIVSTIRITELTKHFGENLSETDFTTTLIIQGIGFCFFSFMVILNFMTGVQASRYENHRKEKPEKNFIKTSKLWFTLWKVLAIMALMLTVACFSLVFSYRGFNGFYFTLTWFNVSFWILAISYEFYSVGENLERRHGRKPGMFLIWDKILHRFEERILKKVSDTSFNKEDQDDTADNSNPL